MRQHAVATIGSLFNVVQSPGPNFDFLSDLAFKKKRPRALSPAVKVREIPRARSAMAGMGCHRGFRFTVRSMPCIDDAQFC